MAPTFYDPESPDEQPILLPNAALIQISPNIVLQPPLSRRGTGPGIIIFLPDPANIVLADQSAGKPLDPDPITKWAEEGFAVVAITGSDEVLLVAEALKRALEALQALKQVDIKQKFAVIVYDSKVVYAVSEVVAKEPRIAAFVGYGSFPAPTCSTIPIMLHLTSNTPEPAGYPNQLITKHFYPTSSTNFVLHQATQYDPGSASLAHSRTLVFLRKGLGGPFFDLEAIWEEHTYFEFEVRSVAKTMGTMVAEPYVNHIPTMTGGIGRKNLTAFYRDHFIFCNPADATLQPVSRTVGADRIVDEFIYHITHDRVTDWLLPSVPPTGKKLSVPMIAIVNVRGDRVSNEHIWWDQATVLRQAGIMPSFLPFPDPNADAGSTSQLLRLPVTGVECAHMLLDESKGKSNEMFGPEWGLKQDQ
ncbi:hypothetical protein BYT27DRAFT_7195092 [Phlegmacium glaucopus]|nr:hypothetical protein BYT27DRAFT_7195092 [Phlegmacium glaucopus]